MSEPFGAWQLESLIAVGGLGEVWRATRDHEVAAVKRLHTHLARNAEARAQFALEQQLARELPRHPNVIHGSDAGDVDGRPYVALDLVPGADLRRIVAPPATRDNAAPAAVTLPRRRALAIVRGAAAGVAHLHAHGYVHGDVCPGNLLIGPGDHVTLIDLGVARRSGEAGAVRGTHAYMAPEQVRGQAWTFATDVFALGVILWELASGTRLFHRGPPWLTIAAVVEHPVPELADPTLDAAAQAALAKDPEQRARLDDWTALLADG